MKIVVHQRRHARGAQAARALAEGCQVHGHTVTVTGAERVTPGEWDAAIIWSANELLRSYTRRGVPVLVAENGYVGDRAEWTSLGWGGLNGEADFLSRDVPPDRWLRYFPDALKPWRGVTAGPVLLVGQVEGDRSLAGQSAAVWAYRMIDELRALGRPVVYRPHPLRPSSPGPHGVRRDTGPLEASLAAAAAVVTFSSTVGVQAVLEGIPTYTAHRISMAWPVAAHSLADLWTLPEPARGPWAAGLAYSQWTHAELESGEAWAHIGAYVEQERAAC